MKKKYFKLTFLLFILIFNFNSCTQNQSSDSTNSVIMSSKEYSVSGTYSWQGIVEIGYGLEATMTLTLIINENGEAISKDYTHETNETSVRKLQWFINKRGAICFGVFNTPEPNENSLGAQFMAYPSNEGLLVGVNKRLYKKMK
jgi:hypothetical protein